MLGVGVAPHELCPVDAFRSALQLVKRHIHVQGQMRNARLSTTIRRRGRGRAARTRHRCDSGLRASGFDASTCEGPDVMPHRIFSLFEDREHTRGKRCCDISSHRNDRDIGGCRPRPPGPKRETRLRRRDAPHDSHRPNDPLTHGRDAPDPPSACPTPTSQATTIERHDGPASHGTKA
jgi:hypothetical protein